ncbi:MAG: flagellar motor protein MotB [Gammaproteobacteria bacterium (ex Lamellibrachia satsuma)]|nr:MAG: type VI secretion system protein TssL [Gammaproteobacteria bacterium (ex Lamellibrachia satsuma)]RRS31739.1 MAG: flagellar motor protein MotB [Gammaproteobacteria bacterium (ex Lamellibrachia satsuma)]RRS35354.1 MAG: flagellar motor protein MotB [Gammaproteobacteria bacterium (ex Lamellibrachia satsuma)]
MADDCPKCETGLPAWLATFADLMSLLMCFFVLLLSFAELDAIRFKKMAESMKDAFGVQTEIPANEIVKGTSVIKQEFSPGKPEETLMEEIRQQTTDDTKDNLDVHDGKQSADEIEVDEAMKAAMQAQLEAEVEQQAEELAEMLEEEIEEGMLEVETEQTKIIIRIREKGSFPSGRASLDPGFFDVVTRITDVVAETPGNIVVAGHTDNIPISTQRFRSNWELSSARAVTVVHAMLSNSDLDPARVLIEGHADSNPLAPNDSRENRAKNRRVELVIERGQDEESGEVLNVSE